MSDLSTSTFTDDAEFQARVDELLSSALQDQAREKRVLIETVHGAKAALVKAQEELTALRQMVDKRDTAVVDLLEARLSGIGTEQTLEEVAEKLDGLAKRPGANEAVAPISVRIDSLASRIDQIADALSKIDVWAPVTELQRSFAAKLHEEIAPVSEALGEAAERTVAHIDEARAATLSEVAEQISGSVGALDEAIANRLQRLEEGVHEGVVHSRDHLDSSVETLSKRMVSRFASLEEALAGDVDVAQEAISQQLTLAIASVGERLTEIASRTDERLASIREASSDSRELLSGELERFATQVGEAIEAVGAETQALAERMVTLVQASDARVFDRMQKVVDGFGALNSRLSEVVADIDERLEEARNSQELRSSAVAKHVESIREVVAEGEATRNDAFARNLMEVTQAFVEERARSGESITEALTPFIIEMEKMGERIRQTNRRITESNTRIEAFQESLIAYLADRDQKLEEVRDRVIMDVIERVGEGLRAGERRKLADALKDAQARRADRRDAEKYRMMKNHPSVKEPKVADVRSGIELQVQRTSGHASELLTEVEAEMPAMGTEPLAEPENELLLEPTPIARGARKSPPRKPTTSKPQPRSETKPATTSAKPSAGKKTAVPKKPSSAGGRSGGTRRRAV